MNSILPIYFLQSRQGHMLVVHVLILFLNTARHVSLLRESGENTIIFGVSEESHCHDTLSLSFFCTIYLKSFLNYEVSLISSVAKSFFDECSQIYLLLAIHQHSSLKYYCKLVFMPFCVFC